jgi:hypothetical protein
LHVGQFLARRPRCFLFFPSTYHDIHLSLARLRILLLDSNQIWSSITTPIRHSEVKEPISLQQRRASLNQELAIILCASQDLDPCPRLIVLALPDCHELQIPIFIPVCQNEVYRLIYLVERGVPVCKPLLERLLASTAKDVDLDFTVDGAGLLDRDQVCRAVVVPVCNGEGLLGTCCLGKGANLDTAARSAFCLNQARCHNDHAPFLRI